MTFQAYQRSRRLGAALRDVRNGNPLLDVGLDAGYASASAFRDAFAKLFGRPPRDARDADGLFARRIETPLGAMLALADDEGLRLLDFLDRPDITRKAASFGESLGRAVVHGDHPHARRRRRLQLDAYFAGLRLTFDLAAWPRSARRGSSPSGRACGRSRPGRRGRTCNWPNPSAGRPRAAPSATPTAAIRWRSSSPSPPRHPRAPTARSPASAGGPWRKQWLLDHERAHLGRAGSAGDPSP